MIILKKKISKFLEFIISESEESHPDTLVGFLTVQR